MYLWKVVAFQEKIYSHEREIKSPVSLPLSARVLGAHERQSESLRTITHSTPSRTPLSVFRRRKPAKRLSRSRSLSRKGDVFFPSLGCSLSHANSFPYIFFHFKKVVLHARSLLLSLSHTHAKSSFAWNRWDDGILPLSFLRIHRSESLFVQRKRRKGIRFNFCLKTPELMIFERKEKLPLARNERNESNLQKREKRARKRKNCRQKHERKKNEKKEKKCVTNAPTKQAHHTPQLKNA